MNKQELTELVAGMLTGLALFLAGMTIADGVLSVREAHQTAWRTLVYEVARG